MLFQLSLFAILLLIAPVFAQERCVGAGYDVSVAARDLYIRTATSRWYLHPCGNVTALPACANAQYGSMLCQASLTNDNTLTANIAIYNETTASEARWIAMPNGVQYTIQTGTICTQNQNAGGVRRSATVYFVCNQTAIQPYFSEIIQSQTCMFVATIQTSSACAAVGPTMSNEVGSSFWSTQCGGGLYDMSSMTSTDLFFQTPSNDYWVRVCGVVSNSTCANASPSGTSFCQKPRGSTSSAVDMSSYNQSEANIWSITPTGIQMQMQDGLLCTTLGATVRRRAFWDFRCNPYIGRPFISYVEEDSTCSYRAVIQTPAVCSGSNGPSQGYCGGKV